MNVNPAKLRLGILGVGHFGRFHALKAAANPAIHLIGLHDASAERAAQIAGEASAPALTPGDVIAAAEAVIIAAPTRFHYALAEQALAAGRHVFIEKPIAASLDQADRLIALAARQGRVLQVGHIERFSAAFRTVMGAPSGGRALSFEAVRAAPFRPRSLDVSVVLDLMIHDVDLILSLVDSELESVDCSGARVLTNDIDIANARIRFANGCVANVTASRVSSKSERKMRVFQSQACHSLDFQARTLTTYRGAADPMAAPENAIERQEQSFGEADPLYSEIVDFVDSIRQQRQPKVTGRAGRRALEAVQRITEATRLIS